VVHDLQQDVEEVGGAFSISSISKYGVRVLADAVGHQAALVEADVTGRSADQPGDRMFLHVLRHVEADELHPQN